MKKLIIVSDVHLARSWDHVSSILPKDINFCNPNTWFKRVVGRIKDNQKLIINGDIVDYYYADYDNETEENTNWDLFSQLIKDCKGDIHCNLGNHDYRKSPYNYSIFPLTFWNVSRKQQRLYRKAIGNYKFRWLKEFRSVAVDTYKFNSLAHYPDKNNYTVVNGSQKLIFLDTGPDLMSNTRYWKNPFVLPYAFTMVWSRGLLDEQILYLQKSLDDSTCTEVVVFVHCPPFSFFRNRKKFKLRQSTTGFLCDGNLVYKRFVINNNAFMDTLLGSSKNIILVASHTHQSKNYLIGKKTLLVEDVSMGEINNHRSDQNYIKMLITYPLGAISHPDKKVGTLEITSKNIVNKVLWKYQ